jgi:hypothetical protein
MSRARAPALACALSLASALSMALTGCESAGADGPVARVQQRLSVEAFEAEVAADPDLAAAVSLAMADTYATGFSGAGTLEDDDGVKVVFAVLDDDPDYPTVVVRHCRGADCVSAVQVDTGDDADVAWYTAGGEIPVRTAAAPFQLRLIDEEDPDGTAVIAPIDGDGSVPTGLAATPGGLAGATGGLDRVTAALDEPDPGTPRKLVLASAFGKYLTTQGPNIDDLASSMKKGGFSDTKAIYHVNTTEVDAQLKGLGRSDAFVWLTHGDKSKKTGKVVGMTTAWGYWGSEHYPASRMTEQLAKNTSGGPGLVILAGCQTSDLIPTFDNGSRVVLAFNNKIMPGQAKTVVRTFFQALSEGKTMREALDAANAMITTSGLALVANPGADLGKRLVDVGAAGSCSPDFAGSWAGLMTVTSGSDKLPTGTTHDYECGQVTFTMGDHPACKGCYLTGKFVARELKGCAEDNTAILNESDGGSTLTMSLNLLSKTQLFVDLDGVDTGGAAVERTATLTKCD